MDRFSNILFSTKNRLLSYSLQSFGVFISSAFVDVNYNMVDYLPRTHNPPALNIMNSEFTESMPNASVMAKTSLLRKRWNISKAGLHRRRYTGYGWMIWWTSNSLLKWAIRIRSRASIKTAMLCSRSQSPSIEKRRATIYWIWSAAITRLQAKPLP